VGISAFSCWLWILLVLWCFQVRARLRHEINLAKQEGKSEEDVQR
jgi:hypothetical protein